MRALLKRKLASIVLRAFNRVFHSQVTFEDIPGVRLLSRARLRVGDEDIDLIRGLLGSRAQIRESLRIVLNQALQLSEQDVRTIHALRSGGHQVTEDEIRDLATGAQLTYSQEGESLVLERIFAGKATGFYVDVGAHHPKRFSNTHSLYKKGWHGINIDPTPGVMGAFLADRPRDVFVSAAVSSEERIQDFYIFIESALNTFNKGLADQYQQAGYKLAEVRPFRSRTLTNVLDECKIDRPIDMMSIDVEGHELNVLRSNDWQRYRPRILLVEIIDFDLSTPDTNAVHNFVVERGYGLIGKTYNTVFYKDAIASNSESERAAVNQSMSSG